MESIHLLHSLAETDKYNTLGIPDTIDVTKRIINTWIQENKSEEPESLTFAIETIPNAEFMGLLGVKFGKVKNNSAEIWYKIHPTFWNKGYATEIVSAVINYGFETLHLHRIEAGCAVDNVASTRVLEKAGMIREGRKRQVLLLTSGWSDNFIYAIIETDER